MNDTIEDQAGRLYRLAWTTRIAVLASHRRDSCIESTRAAIPVFRYYGHNLVPVPTTAAFYTADAYATNSAAGYSVGVAGTGDAGGGAWDGHLVGLADDRWLVDVSADQFDRPAKGIHIGGPIVVPASRAQLDAGMTFRDDDTGLVAVYRTIDSRAWRRAPAWTSRPAAFRAIAGEAIRALGERSVTV